MNACRGGAVLALAGVFSAPAASDSWGGGAGVATDKVLRGLSQSGGRATLLLDLFYRSDGGWSLSLGAASLPSAVHQTAAEWTASLARHWQLDDDWASQLSATHYGYPGRGDARYRSYDEASVSIAWRGLWSLSATLAPQTRGQAPGGRAVRGTSVLVETAAHLPLVGRWSLDAGLGWYDNHRIGGTPYSFASLGASWGLGPVQLSLARVTSRADERGRVSAQVAGDRWLGTAWWTW